MKTAEEMSNLFEEIKNEKEARVKQALEARRQEAIRYCDEELEAIMVDKIKNFLSRSFWLDYYYRVDDFSHYCLEVDRDLDTDEVTEIDLEALEEYLLCSGYKVTSQIHKDKMRVYIEY
jgi:hypothetical protein